MYYSKFQSPLNFSSKRSLSPPFVSPQGKRIKPMKIMTRGHDDLVDQDQKLILSQDQNKLEDHVAQAKDERQHLITMYEQRHGLSRTPTPTPPTPTSPEPTVTYKGAWLNQDGTNTPPTPVHSPSYKDVLLKNTTAHATNTATPTPSPTPVHSPSQLVASSPIIISTDSTQQTPSPTQRTPSPTQRTTPEVLRDEIVQLQHKNGQLNKKLLGMWRQIKQLRQNNEQLKQQHEKHNGQLSTLLKQNKRLGQQKQQLEAHAKTAVMKVLRQKQELESKAKELHSKVKELQREHGWQQSALGPSPDTSSESDQAEVEHTVPTTHCSGAVESLMEGMPIGLERTNETDSRLRELAVAPPLAKHGLKAHYPGLPRGYIWGISYVQEAVFYLITHLPPAKRKSLEETKDGIARYVAMTVYGLSKFMVFLLQNHDMEVGHIYKLESFLQYLTFYLITSFLEHLSSVGFRQNSLKTLEFHLSFFISALRVVASKQGLGQNVSWDEIIGYLSTSSASRSKPARDEARSSWTREQIKMKCGMQCDPTPAQVYKVYCIALKHAKKLLKKMLANNKQGLAAVATLSSAQHTMLQACLATCLAMAMGGARCSLIRLCRLSWFQLEGQVVNFDPTKDESMLKRGRWSNEATRALPKGLGQMFMAYMLQLQLACGEPSLDVHTFWDAGDQYTVFLQAHTEHEIQHSEQCQQEFADLYLNGPLVDVSFMSRALQSTVVGLAAFCQRITQLALRHIIAWMQYEIWHKQLDLDLVGRQSRYINVTFDEMITIASADANNNPETWQRIYAIDGMSRHTALEEEARQVNGEGVSSDSDDTDDFENMLREMDLQLVPVKGDGNCQFRALSVCMFGSDKHHRRLRNRVCDFMEEHPEHFEGYNVGTHESHVVSMRANGTWGDHTTLVAAASAFGVAITVWQRGNGNQNHIVEPLPAFGEARAFYHLAFTPELHYEALVYCPGSSTSDNESGTPDNESDGYEA